MAPTALDKAIQERNSVTDTIDVLQQELTDDATTPLTETEVDQCLQLIKSVQVDVMEIHKKIQSCSPADPAPHQLIYQQLLRQTLKLLGGFTGLKMKFPTSNAQSPSDPSVPRSTTTEIRLPKLELPTFDGNLEDWISFRDMFTTAVHENTKLSKSQKFTYLRSQLKGEALRQIQSMIITDANYDIAWKQLSERYHNDRELLFAILKRFVNQSQLHSSSAVSIRQLVDISRECIRSLDVLQLPTDQWGAILMYHIFHKLDKTSKELWEQGLKDSSIPTLDSLFEFLEQRARALAAGGSCPDKPSTPQPQKEFDRKRRSSGHNLTHTTQSSDPCKVCSGRSHPLFKCSGFQAMSIPARIEELKKQNLCFNCLRGGHMLTQCPSTRLCRICNKNHNTLIHRGRGQDATAAPLSTPQPLTHHTQWNVNSSHPPSMRETLLATALVMIPDKFGQPQPCRAFLDNGSNRHYVTEACVRRLGLPREKLTACITGLGQEKVGTAKGATWLNVSPHFDVHKSLPTRCLIIPKITGKLPTYQFNHSSCSHLQNLQLADPDYFTPGHIDILLGSEFFFAIIQNGKKSGPPGSPVALNSTLGWLVGGGSTENPTHISTFHLSSQPINSNSALISDNDSTLDKTLRAFWEIESMPSISILTPEENACEAHFKSTYTRDKSGRFTVRLPLKTPLPIIGSSLDIATRRLKSIERRLSRQPNYRNEYNKFMREYEELGHMVEVPATANDANMCYIPHHFIVKESSTTTKFRVVFDASAKTSSGVSLNNTMMVGPTIQDNLVDILLRFRLHPIAFTADLAKMYRQIQVGKEDTDLQRILWRNNISHPIKHFKLLTVTYGTAAAPFLATRVLKELANIHEDTFPLASKIAKEDFYVDDVLSGAKTLKSALQIKDELLNLLSKGGFTLRKWNSNSPALLKSLDRELRDSQDLQSLDSDATVKTLGVFWNPASDHFVFKISPGSSSKPLLTKRIVLSEIARIYDPIGFLAPIIIVAKLLMQDIWKSSSGWDDVLRLQIQSQWFKFKQDLNILEELRITRHFCPSPTSEILTFKYQACLAGFCDASERAYAAVVYMCIYNDSSPPVISIITSKTRVAPTKPTTIPTLELCGALLLAELMHSVQVSLKIQFHSISAWTDSTVVLTWLRSHPSRWKNFVANRAVKIQELFPASIWGHVRGVDNPADCASRGISTSELLNHPLWWRGPHWLHVKIPDLSEFKHEDDPCSLNEQKQIKICATTHALAEFPCKFSSLLKLKRVTAYILRFLNNFAAKFIIRIPSRSGPLTPGELHGAMLQWIKLTQQADFSSELQCLTQKEPIKTSSKLLSLNPYLDDSSILRVGGRLRHSQLPLDQCHPILLPRHARISQLIIQDEHLKNFHAGPQLVLSSIQRHYWIVRARDAVRQQLRKCVVCTRHRAETMQQLMADLPAYRVTPARAFLKCGIDYAGPFLIKPIQPRSKITIKSYLAIFICCSTRAIHLEVVSGLSTDAFLAALRRFVSRRGRPADMYSDCGTNFVGASREMKEMIALIKSSSHNQFVADQLSKDGIQWHFNPPAAPHFGGLWEAGVKSTKYHLKRIMGSTRLTFEEMTTLVIQIEAILNSRPLTQESCDPNDLSALTPGHFLIGSALTAIPEPNLTHLKINRLSQWQLIQQLTQHFWRRWSSEYITRLQQRPKWMSQKKSIDIGDLVIVKDDNYPPMQWRLGRVTSLHPGPDNIVRVVTLKTSEGTLKRPIVKLCLLPVEHLNDELDPPATVL